MNTTLLRLVIILVILGVAGIFVTQLLNTGTSGPEVRVTEEAAVVEESTATGPQAEAPEEAIREMAEASEAVRKQQPDGLEGDFQTGTGGFSGSVKTKTGQPIADAKVSLFVGPTMMTLSLESTLKNTNLTTTTDSDGTYSFDNLPPRNDYVVAADHPEYARNSHGGITVPENDMIVIPDVILGQGMKVSGVVRAAKGGPIAGATVELYDAVASGFQKTGQKKPFHSVLTDASGQYEFTNISFNSMEVIASAEGYATVARSDANIFQAMGEQSDRTLDFVLRQATQLSGIVIDGRSKPIANAIVSAMQVGVKNNRDGMSKGTVLTGEDGTFLFDRIAAGTYILTCMAEGYTDMRESGVEAGTTGVTLLMDRKGSVSGVVYAGVAGKPMTQFSLRLLRYRPDGRPYGLAKAQVFNSSNGTFLYQGADPGSYVLEAQGRGFAPTHSGPFSVKGDGQTTEGVTIIMSKGGEIRGIVVSTSGEPVSGAVVRLKDNNYVPNPLILIFDSLPGAEVKRSPQNRTNSKGEFEFTMLIPDTYQVEVDMKKFAPARRNDVIVVKDEVTNVGRITISEGGSISGVCQDAAGRPFSDTTVNVMGADNGWHDVIHPDIDGYFEVPNLLAGEYTLTLNPNSLAGEPINPLMRVLVSKDTMQKVQVRDGGDTQVVLRLPPPK
ncbi:MAG: carboxypeptidase-like regulatory domain-containing protein [Planctomycetota bacterium]